MGECGYTSGRLQRAVYGVHVRTQDTDDEAPVPAVLRCRDNSVAQFQAGEADGRGEVLRETRHRHEANRPAVGGAEVDAEGTGRVPRAEVAEEGAIVGVPEPSLGDDGGADEARR